MTSARIFLVIGLAALALWAQSPTEGDGKGKAKGGRGGKGAAEAKAIVPPPDPQVLRLVRPDLYLITGDGGNSVFRVTPEGVILVDTKLAKEGAFERLKELIRGVTPQSVKFVMNTHQHPDHAGNNANFTAEPGVGAGVRSIPLLAGHTGSDVAIYFQADRLIAVGDVLSPNRAPSIDYTSGGGLLGIPRALDTILALDWTVAIPGHGDPVNRAFVESYRIKVTTLIERAREAVARGVAKEQLLGQIKVDDLGWQPLQMDGAQLGGFYAEIARR